MTNTLWRALDTDDISPYMTMQEKNSVENANVVIGGGMEIETRDSTEKNAGSNEESENDQPMLRNLNSLNSDPDNPGDVLNTTNEI